MSSIKELRESYARSTERYCRDWTNAREAGHEGNARLAAYACLVDWAQCTRLKGKIERPLTVAAKEQVARCLKDALLYGQSYGLEQWTRDLCEEERDITDDEELQLEALLATRDEFDLLLRVVEMVLYELENKGLDATQFDEVHAEYMRLALTVAGVDELLESRPELMPYATATLQRLRPHFVTSGPFAVDEMRQWWFAPPDEFDAELFTLSLDEHLARMDEMAAIQKKLDEIPPEAFRQSDPDSTRKEGISENHGPFTLHAWVQQIYAVVKDLRETSFPVPALRAAGAPGEALTRALDPVDFTVKGTKIVLTTEVYEDGKTFRLMFTKKGAKRKKCPNVLCGARVIIESGRPEPLFNKTIDEDGSVTLADDLVKVWAKLRIWDPETKQDIICLDFPEDSGRDSGGSSSHERA